MRVADIRQHFISELKAENFAIDKTGVKTIELIGASFVADESAIFGEPNDEYIEAELVWYASRSTNVNDIKYRDKVPQAWQYTANAHGEINSNYGHLIWSSKYYDQYISARMELMNNPFSRRAIMIYNRPSMWVEYKENGKNDFVCTNAVSYYIRDNKLHAVVQMRSNDVVFGYKNDYAWQFFVLARLARDLNVEIGDIHWQVQNLHVYSQHFDIVKGSK